MMRYKFEMSSIVFMLFVVFTMAACSGSSSSDSQSGTITGSVADGYLSGATVFLDCNDNRVRDTDEVSDTTDSSGQYVLDTSGIDNVADCPVVAEVTDTTIDLDTNIPVRNAYTLVSPPGYTDFVSPLTTMIQVNYESNPGVTVSEAHDAVKEMLSVGDQASVSLFEDYIDNSTTGATDADTYEDLHKFAQVTARVLGDNLDQLEQAAQAQNYTITDDIKDDLLRLTVKEIMQNADKISEVVNTDDPAEDEALFNPDADSQAVDITVDTGDVDQVVQQEQTIFVNQVPSLKYAGIFRANWPSGFGDILVVGLENEIDTTGYEFSVQGPGGFSYTFVAADFYNDPYAAVAMYKVYDDPGRDAGEYIFYITPSGGTRTEVARDTHVQKAVPVVGSSNTTIMINGNGAGRAYHDTLNGAYYYRIVIRDADTEDIVYRGKRKNSSVRGFPAQYATADYQYRIEAWDALLFRDAVARSQTGWKDFGTVLTISSSGAEPSYYGAYWRRHYSADGTTLLGNRKVLDIAVTNHEDLTALTITSNLGFSYTLPVSAEVGFVDNNSDYYFEKKSYTFTAGEPVVDYYLQIKNPSAGAETFTWTATTDSGGDFAISATIQAPNPLPCVDPDSVTMTEDSNGLLTIGWDGVTAGASGQGVSYRLRIRNNDGTNALYRSKRMPKTTIYIPRSDIEDVIDTVLTDADVQYRIEVIDSSIYSTIHNWTQFDYQSIPLE